MVPRPIRVLQVIYRADRAGAESWLVQLLGRIDRQTIAVDFIVHDPKPGAFDAEILSRGARILVSDRHKNLVGQMYRLWRIQRQYGPYDVIHSHVDYYGGLVALFGRMVGIPARVTHSHSDTRSVDSKASLGRKMYTRLMKRLVLMFSTAGIGTSSGAAESMFGKDWRADRRWHVVPACVDLSRFVTVTDPDSVRALLGITPDAVVFGTVARLAVEKNHGFLISVASTVARRNPKAIFVLVGDGPMRGEIEATIDRRQLREHFRVLGSRDDVPSLMSAMDFFIFPSLYEGLGLALVEAQAAGLRSFVSDGVSSQSIAVPEMVRVLPLSAGPEAWADAIMSEVGTYSPVSKTEALRITRTSFDMQRNVSQVAEFYQTLAS